MDKSIWFLNTLLFFSLLRFSLSLARQVLILLGNLMAGVNGSATFSRIKIFN